MALLNNLGLQQWAAWVDQRFMKKQTILGSNPETTGPKVTGIDPGTLGQMALDSTNVYICTVAGDSTTAIWKAISLVEDMDDLSLYQTKTDNTLDTVNKTIVGSINEVREIALGAQKAFVFATKVDMDAWLLIPANVAKLSTGNYLLIREVNVPDYWWDGTTNTALELEVKIDLTNYYTKTEVNNLLTAANKQSIINSIIF